MSKTIHRPFQGESAMTVNQDDSGYIGLVLEKLVIAGIKVGDTIKIIQSNSEHSGILMPRSQVGVDSDHIIIKLDNGYNIGIKLHPEVVITRIKGVKKKKKPSSEDNSAKLSPLLPTVAVLSTGGTIASKVDYRTGAVNPALSAQDLYDSVPELKEHANIEAKVITSMLSENIHPEDWTKIARSIAKEIKKGVDGVVVAHGTDTMGYTASALSFALQNIPVPIALVGSQRSSDRPSSDAALNLIGATDLVGKADAAEVMVVMHAKTDDSFLYAHRGTRVRKSHTSRRDAFQSINDYPLFKIEQSKITELNPPLLKRNPERKLKLKPLFEEKVALIKTHPGISGSIIDYYVSKEYKGIIIEGTGLGHVPDRIQQNIRNAIDEGLIVAMSSQCISGRIDMNVYRSGVELLGIGVISCEDMFAETALVKLMWLLANTNKPEKVRSLLGSSLVGEIDSRSENAEFVPKQEFK